VAVLGYNLMQFGLYGLFGATAAAFAPGAIGVTFPWWLWALFVWAAVAVLGVREIRVSAKVLAVLSLVEIVVIVAISVVGLYHSGPDGIAVSTLSPSRLWVPGMGAAGVLAITGYVGFEGAPVFSEEARDPRRTVAVATLLVLAGIAVVYVLASLAIVTHYGIGQVGTASATLGPDTLFGLAGPVLANVGRGLFLTSMFAALLAFHNAVGRYMFSLGRETFSRGCSAGPAPAAVRRGWRRWCRPPWP
jgi:amino acid transporter